MKFTLMFLFCLICLQTIAIPPTPIEDEQLKALFKEYIKPLAGSIITYPILFGLPNRENKIDKHTHNACVKAATLLNSGTLTDKKGIGWEPQMSNESSFIGARFSQEERELIRITIYSENPDIESSTYSIDEDRGIQQVDLLLLDIELIKKLKGQETR